MQVVAYTRVSTSDQDAGLSAQRSVLEAEVRRRGWEDDVTWVEDEGFTGASLKRPGITHTLATLTRGDVLIVSKLDRLSRSVHDFSGLLILAGKGGWSIIALDVGVDTTTPEGEMHAGMLIVFAQFERRRIGQRIKEAMAEKKAQGIRVTRPCATPPEVAARIRRLRGKELGLRAIAQQLNDDGVATALKGKQWYASTVKSVLDAA